MSLMSLHVGCRVQVVTHRFDSSIGQKQFGMIGNIIEEFGGVTDDDYFRWRVRFDDHHTNSYATRDLLCLVPMGRGTLFRAVLPHTAFDFRVEQPDEPQKVIDKLSALTGAPYFLVRATPSLVSGYGANVGEILCRRIE